MFVGQQILRLDNSMQVAKVVPVPKGSVLLEQISLVAGEDKLVPAKPQVVAAVAAGLVYCFGSQQLQLDRPL
jgi:hypothetical protein